MDTDPSFLKWLYVTIVAPILGWVGGWIHSLRGSKRRKKARIKFLCGLPLEAKAVLIDFNHQGTHTLRGNPSAPEVRLLVNMGVVRVGTGGGTYDAVNSYITIVHDFWEVMDEWINTDTSVLPLLEQYLEKLKHEQSP